MRIEGRLETDAKANRRGAPRRGLRLWLDLMHGSQAAASVQVLNISKSGLLLQTSAPLSEGDTLQVDLPEAGFRPASVAWASGEFVGCRFKEPITAAMVSAARLRSEPSSAEDAQASSAETFGSRLRRLRKQYNLTQPALGRLVNVTKLTVWKWERGDARPRHAALQALARVFAITESELLLGTSARHRELEQSAELSGVVEECKARIAKHFHTAADKVEITVRL